MPEREISFIVTARNEPRDVLAATVTGLLQTASHHDHEIIVIDDGSDEPAALATAGIQIIRNHEAIGIARSRRQGAERASGDVLVWLDAHMSFASDWLDRMLEHLDSDRILCPAFWNYERTICHAYGADYVWHDSRNEQRYPGFAVRHRRRFPAPGAVEVPMLIGACYMMRRTAYERLGGFSPLSRVRGGNEQDLSARAWIADLSVRCVTEAQVGHLWRPRFLYPVEFAHLEFNQLALVRTVFEDETVRRLGRCFQPYSPRIQQWMEEETGLEDWRLRVQASRKLSDAEFFNRFVPALRKPALTPTLPPLWMPPARKGTEVSGRISFVVTARDEPPEILAATVDGLLATGAGRDCEIVIVDDASRVPVAIERPRTTILRHPQPIGVAQSRRAGAAAAQGDVLTWLDAHMRFAPDWLDQMMAHTASGALLCAAWWDYELTRPLCWGAEFRWCTERDHAAGRSPGLSFRHRTRYPGDGAFEVPMVIGACYMMNRESYVHCGGFSPFFRIWGKSEQDLSARMWITGLGVKCVTAARVGHLSRPQFPYPVSWSDIEFNQAIIFRTILEEPTLQAVEQMMRPLPADVETWLAGVDVREYRGWIQSRRQMSDREFFQRFVPEARELLQAARVRT